MPELPEVEFARKQLSRWLTKGKIARATIADARILDAGVKSADVVRALRGKTIRDVVRRGKWLRIALDKGIIFSHFGMTGKWVLAEVDEPVRFEKVRIDVEQAKKRRSVCYIDPRLFGRFVVTENDLKAWTALGPDPLLDGIDAEALHQKLQKRKIAIKQALLDQTVLAGIGNIQATEALFFARIDPRRPAPDITRTETKALGAGMMRAIRETLALQTGPTLAYVEDAGAKNPFKIYGHGGDLCPRCRKAKLAKIVLAGRGTVFCPNCQK